MIMSDGAETNSGTAVPVRLAPAVYARRRMMVASAIAVAVALIVGITASVASAAARTERARGEAAVPPEVVAMSLSSGSLVGGESQRLTGSHLSRVSDVRVGGLSVTELQGGNDSLSFLMPRAASYEAGSAPLSIVVDGKSIALPSQFDYTYEVRTGVDRQLEYAFRYWKNYNLAEFGTFNPVGGDCANFVSQTLLARGWPMTDDWHNFNAGAEWTSSWIYTPAFETWLLENPQLGAVRLELDDRDQVKIGDIVVFDWNGNGFLDHIQIVSAIDKVDGEIQIAMVGHNLDSDFRDLDDTITIDHPGAYAYFYSLPPTPGIDG
jgi:hypothetical protein